MISKELSATLGFAVREAKKRRHEYVSVEHILFAILYDQIGSEIIENCGGNVETWGSVLSRDSIIDTRSASSTERVRVS